MLRKLPRDTYPQPHPNLPVVRPTGSRELSADPRQLLAQVIANRALRMLAHTATLLPGKVAIYAIPRSDRVILVFNLDAIQGMQIPETFFKNLHRVMTGRKVVVDRQTGMLVQIGYWPAQAAQLTTVALNLSEQPSPLHVPIGMTARGQTWLSITEMDSILIGGARRMGKTRLLHAWILALVQGRQAFLVLWDGKNGAEFERYAGNPLVTVAQDLPAALAEVQKEITRRELLFKQRRVTSLPEYNRTAGAAPLPPIVLILDELADLPREAEEALIQLVRRAGAYGVHPVVGIQRPDADVMKGQLKANLTTRFALPVASNEDSRIILGRPGAEKLPKTKGRLLFVWDARLVEAQSFLVDLPDTLADTRPVRLRKSAGLLTERERGLVQAAQECDGWFRVREIAEQAGESRDWVNQVALRWETVGYLTAVQRNPQGHTLGRRVTPELLQAAGFGGQADAADPAGSGGFGQSGGYGAAGGSGSLPEAGEESWFGCETISYEGR